MRPYMQGQEWVWCVQLPRSCMHSKHSDGTQCICPCGSASTLASLLLCACHPLCARAAVLAYTYASPPPLLRKPAPLASTYTARHAVQATICACLWKCAESVVPVVGLRVGPAPRLALSCGSVAGKCLPPQSLSCSRRSAAGTSSGLPSGRPLPWSSARRRRQLARRSLRGQSSMSRSTGPRWAKG